MIKAYEIRRPSRSKAQYLLHLGDCQRKALQDLIAARHFLLQVTKSFMGRLASTTDNDSVKGSIDVQPKLASKVLVDLDYLVEALRPLTDEIDKLQHSVSSSEGNRQGFRQSLMVLSQIEKQMNLAQMQRSMILTVLASIFIPLSFATVSAEAKAMESFPDDRS